MQQNAPILFDNQQLRKQRLRASATLAQHDFLHHEAAARMADRLHDINRHFTHVLDISAQPHWLAAALQQHPRIGTLSHQPLVGETLSCPPASLSAVVCIGTLHWVNDLPGLMRSIAHALAPDGLFMASFPGGETLLELRGSLAYAESQLRGGISPRVSPFLDIRDAGSLLSHAGFALPVIDCDRLTITYPTLFALAKELRAAGETNAMAARSKHCTPRTLFAAAEAHYAAQHSDAEGRRVATLDLLTLTGWKPAPNQQQPLARGSAKHSLKTALE